MYLLTRLHSCLPTRDMKPSDPSWASFALLHGSLLVRHDLEEREKLRTLSGLGVCACCVPVRSRLLVVFPHPDPNTMHAAGRSTNHFVRGCRSGLVNVWRVGGGLAVAHVPLRGFLAVGVAYKSVPAVFFRNGVLAFDIDFLALPVRVADVSAFEKGGGEGGRGEDRYGWNEELPGDLSRSRSWP